MTQKRKGPLCSENGILGYTNEEIKAMTTPTHYLYGCNDCGREWLQNAEDNDESCPVCKSKNTEPVDTGGE